MSTESTLCILYIYSTNIGTEYFKRGIYSPFLSSSKCSLFHNSNVFGSCIIHILYTECAKIKKKSGSKRLIILEPYATQSSLSAILQVRSTCFGCQPHPIISSTQNCNYILRYWSCFLCSYLPPSWPNLACKLAE